MTLITKSQMNMVVFQQFPSPVSFPEHQILSLFSAYFSSFPGFKSNLSNEQDDYHAYSQLSKISKICSPNEITKIWNNWFKRVFESTLAYRTFCDWWWCWWYKHFATPYKCAKEKLFTPLNSEIIRIKKWTSFCCFSFTAQVSHLYLNLCFIDRFISCWTRSGIY